MRDTEKGNGIHVPRVDLDIGAFIDDVRARALDPADRKLFDIYATEAEFGLSVIRGDIDALAPGARILEIGAGILLLSGFLATMGFQVHAVEPVAPGFSHARKLQQAILRHYEKIGLRLALVESDIEDFAEVDCFDYAFSINVFEHIRDIEQGLSNAYRSLRPPGALRIYCPNYRFPYEPHFNIPTLFSKRLTEFVFMGAILNSKRVTEARETWDGLNWINVARVERFFRERFTTRPAFNSRATYLIASRIMSDPQFAARRSSWMSLCLRQMSRSGLLHLFKLIPVAIAPVMDFRIEKE
jgi:SAM-dependent methyltransferase